MYSNEKGVESRKERTLKRGDSADLPGGPGVQNPACDAGDAGAIPGPGGSHLPRSHSAPAPQLPNWSPKSPGSARREAAAVRSPHTATEPGPGNQSKPRGSDGGPVRPKGGK